MNEDKEMNIQMRVEAGSVVLLFDHPEETLEIPMTPEAAIELGYDLVEHATIASETNEK